jgi:K+-sensing histidine kinase KdpD
VTGAATTLLEDDAKLTTAARRDLTETIHEEAQRLSRLVRNLLDMTRVQSGALRVTKEWQPLEEVVGAALARVGTGTAAGRSSASRCRSRGSRRRLRPDSERRKRTK